LGFFAVQVIPGRGEGSGERRSKGTAFQLRQKGVPHLSMIFLRERKFFVYRKAATQRSKPGRKDLRGEKTNGKGLISNNHLLSTDEHCYVSLAMEGRSIRPEDELRGYLGSDAKKGWELHTFWAKLVFGRFGCIAKNRRRDRMAKKRNLPTASRRGKGMTAPTYSTLRGTTSD